MTSVTTEVRLPAKFKGVSNPAIHRTHHVPERQHSFVVWITLIGIFFPPVLVPLGGMNFTPGRFVALLFLAPALGILLKRGRNRVASDFYAVALAAWIFVSSLLNGGFRPYVGAEALEFLGAYLVGRAFVFGPSNLRTFVKALWRITIILVALALLDILTRRNFTLDFFGIPHYPQERSGLVRAASVFEDAEHYGTFCAAAAAIFFYSELGIRRVLYVSLCFLGCAFSLSSGPYMGLAIVTATFFYDRVLKQYSWRWKALTITISGFLIVVFLISDHPIAWVLGHLTLDPQTGWFRLGTWQYALPLIELSPFTGYGLTRLGDSTDAQLFLWSVDCVWLVVALRYGLPAVVLLVLTMYSAILRRRRISTFRPGTYFMATGFSLAIVAMGFVGLTVHFWDAIWLFLSLCIGIRASLGEYEHRATIRLDGD
jgi:hypothetical protein